MCQTPIKKHLDFLKVFLEILAICNSNWIFIIIARQLFNINDVHAKQVDYLLNTCSIDLNPKKNQNSIEKKNYFDSMEENFPLSVDWTA